MGGVYTGRKGRVSEGGGVGSRERDSYYKAWAGFIPPEGACLNAEGVELQREGRRCLPIWPGRVLYRKGRVSLGGEGGAPARGDIYEAWAGFIPAGRGVSLKTDGVEFRGEGAEDGILLRGLLWDRRDALACLLAKSGGGT